MTYTKGAVSQDRKSFEYVKTQIAPDKLADEIASSAIVTALADCQLLGTEDLTVNFKAALSETDEGILDGLVETHDGIPIVENPIAQVEVQNFPSTLVDSDGAQITKPKTTNTGWHYEPRSIDYETGKYNSHYNRKHNGDGMYDGTDYNDAWLTFLDAAGDVMVKGGGESDAEFQARLDTDCITTFLDWQATYSFDIIGGMLQVISPEVTAYMWAIIAPDIPEAYGGSVPFLAGGFNLKFFRGNVVEKFDGRGVKRINPDFVYNSSKFRIIVKHPVGARIPVQVYFEHFKA